MNLAFRLIRLIIFKAILLLNYVRCYFVFSVLDVIRLARLFIFKGGRL